MPVREPTFVPPDPAVKFPLNNQTSYWLVGQTSQDALLEARLHNDRPLPYCLPLKSYKILGAFLDDPDADLFVHEYLSHARKHLAGQVVFKYQKWSGAKDKLNVIVKDKLWLELVALKKPFNSR